MSTEQPIVADTSDDLDAFSAELFGQSTKEAEPASSKEDKSEEKEEDAPNEDTHSEADTLDTDDEDNDDKGEEDDAKSDDEPKPKKNRFQERIDEVVGKQREAERKAEELSRKLEEALQRLNKDTKEPAPKPQAAKVDTTGPQPTDVNEDGTDKYPLGEFDPTYIKDLMRHTLDEERKAREETTKQEKEQAERDQAQAALQQEWNTKLVSAKERYPDFQEKGQQMLGTFEKIDEAYGEYLTNTIMEMEYGPDVFYYLASNTDVAAEIVNSGAKRATIALGRLEAKFADAAQDKKQARPKVSDAPTPPPTNKGSAVAGVTIKGDEDDLDAFSKALFKKK